ncbi:shikimate dehydrogenase family protein [Sodalis glossinidius]|uniref:shikimate dehydrogenase family protein n=1 Tax=Sodalis glossinidius TaxID=63612 RepID=UPI0002D9B7C5|nr:hypothetical protein [Sodalis glossinidius]
MLAAAGIDAVVVALNITPANLSSTVRSLIAADNVDGFFVTFPHKLQMLAFADRLLQASLRTGATNALRREPDGSWSAYMFDGQGFVNALLRKGLNVGGKHVRLYGAGGAGMVIAAALADASAELSRLWTGKVARPPGPQRCATSLPESGKFNAESNSWREADVIVNASPVGMKDSDGLPEPLGNLAAGTIVGDVVIHPGGSALIAHAKAFSCSWVDGADMHSGQMEVLMHFFHPHITQ